jgi:hypothetical protein
MSKTMSCNLILVVAKVRTTPELEIPPSRRPESWDYGVEKGFDKFSKKWL